MEGKSVGVIISIVLSLLTIFVMQNLFSLQKSEIESKDTKIDSLEMQIECMKELTNDSIIHYD